MNILEYRRKVLGYTFRGDADDIAAYYTPVSTPTSYVPPPSLNPLEAATQGYNSALQALNSAGGEDQGPAMANYQAAQKAFVAAGGVMPESSNNLGFLGNFFAGVDSSLGLSKGATAISGGLADLDSSLELSKNAPAIVGLAAAYFLPGIGQALGQSLVSSGIITGAAIPYATTIGTALTQTGVSVAQGKSLDKALGDAILSAGIGELTKAYGVGVQTEISKITSNSIAQNAIFKAGTDVVTAVAQGKTGEQVLQGIGNSVISSVAGAAANEVVENIPGINNLSEAQKDIVRTGVATSIQGGDGTKSMVNAAINLGVKSVLDVATKDTSVADAYNDPSRALDVVQSAADAESKAAVQKVYLEVLGRDADLGGLEYWAKEFGPEVSEEELRIFRAGAKAELDAKVAAQQAADKVAADKVISDKVAADKVISDKAIADQKVIDDQVAADKVISDKVAADKAIADQKVIDDQVAADKVISDQVAAALADSNSTDPAEAAEIFTSVYGYAPKAGELADYMGKSEADVKALLGKQYLDLTNSSLANGVVTADAGTGTVIDAGGGAPTGAGITTNQSTQLKDESGSALKLTDAEINALVNKQLIFDGGDYNTKQDAANAARLAGYTQFDYDNSVYSMTGAGSTEKDVFQALIDDAPNKKEAFRIARNLLGADKTFDYKGSPFTTSYLKVIPQSEQEVIGGGEPNTSASRAGIRVGMPVTIKEGASYLTDQEKSVNQRIKEAYEGSTLSKIIGTPDDAMRTFVTLKDVALSPGQGVVQGIKGIADFYGIITGDLDNPVSTSMRGLLNNFDALTSDKTKQTLVTIQQLG